MKVSDSLLLTTGIDGDLRTAKLWDFKEGYLKIVLNNFEKSIFNLAILDDHSFYATSG
jgi:hypothetical protein